VVAGVPREAVMTKIGNGRRQAAEPPTGQALELYAPSRWRAPANSPPHRSVRLSDVQVCNREEKRYPTKMTKLLLITFNYHTFIFSDHTVKIIPRRETHFLPRTVTNLLIFRILTLFCEILLPFGGDFCD